MAVLKLENGTFHSDLINIAQELAPLNIQINRWTVADNPELQRLLAQDSLNEQEKEQVLTALDSYFEQLQQIAGYQSRDLVVLHPGIPNLDELMAKFDKIHTHADDEVRYIIDGEAIFGFVLPDGSQVELTVQTEEYINVPAGTEHWFYLTPARRVKAVRYFITTEGWIPQYTGREIRTRQLLVR
ncbi:acireductone dioxygenase [Sphaerospermopsis aphanizomenoides BCCUSP55]|uniref:1,2-dihydroxy-3-keto-5-methylthiopentene dioxygenase n=1 Tax=Sphaerospermopsis aphanizomenoides TaxID=459663 RepID=UPI000B2484FA|nr:acireductone dioxygenase [Sphaerospermopsis aphanizomenoides]MBK1987665.1 acireductone dioxygenase [Sphaerospermopsis aphanizomenoides BCCUSP55]